MEAQRKKKLVIKSFHVQDVRFSPKPHFTDGTLGIPPEILRDDDLVKSTAVSIIQPGDPDKWVNTIMDIVPISSKVLGRLGEGITHTFTGAYVMITGVDEDGRQMHEFGSSEGMLSQQLKRGRYGTPNDNDLIIHLDFLLKGGQVFDRCLTMAVFDTADGYVQELRKVLKDLDGTAADEKNEYYDKVAPGKLKVAMVKQVAGQGAMYDNMLFPEEPSGVKGISIIDLMNMPVVLTPNEYRDGALRAMV